MLAKCAEGGAELGHYVDVDASREVPIGKLCGGVLVPRPRGDTGVPPGVAAARPVPCGDIGVNVDPDQLLARYVQHGRWAVGVLNRPRCLKTTTMVSCHHPAATRAPSLHRPHATRGSSLKAAYEGT